ncbi:hypothetical protein AAVH_28341 [Aphelenchoides avenae]|nr:hypothetical protein AAVH_28341 [Aphelenchus avenae]
MTGNQGSRLDRGHQDAYEARSTRIQHHLWDLQDEFEKLAAHGPRLQDLSSFDHRQYQQLRVQIHASIDQIRSHITDYKQAVSDWDALIDEFRLRDDPSTWARNQLRHHEAHFSDPTVAPSLYYKFCELMHIYEDARYNLELLLRRTNTQNNQATRPATCPPGGGWTKACPPGRYRVAV